MKIAQKLSLYVYVAVILLLASSGYSQSPAAEAKATAAPAPKTTFDNDTTGDLLFGAQFGWHFFDDQIFGGNKLRNRGTLGLRLGYGIIDHFDLEGAFTFVPSKSIGSDVDLYTYDASAVGNLFHNHFWTPYASLGIGGYSLDAPNIGISRHDLAAFYAAGVKWFFREKLALRAEVRGITLITDNETNVEATIGLIAYSGLFSGPRDRDKDGVPDKFDKCPKEAEDKDTFQDEDGCPEADNDGDGIADDKDKCPNVAEDKDSFQDEDGCPELDNDADGVADAMDKCPTQAEDKDGFQDEDGCPELDNDNDGIADDKDQCPLQAEDKDNFHDEDGCPESDNDNDGVPDDKDACPNQPETVNGVLDDDGCPDTDLKKFSGVIGGIKFAFGSNTIDLTSYPVLDEAAAAFREYPDISFIIEGHTDSVGGKKKNLKLSRDRAEAVRQYLVAKGISPFRMRIAAYGLERPIASNSTETGRAQNRRIEFKFLSEAGKPKPSATPPAATTAPEMKPAAPAATPEAKPEVKPSVKP
jgi:outer membrane protein OmpA-like peptidoglycan-associated protein